MSSLLDRLKRAVTPHHDEAPRDYAIRLVVGLGNPGEEYAGNRHNLGFWVMNRLAKKHGLKFETKGQAAVAEGEIAGRRVALAKPRTYVNRSGDAVWGLIKRFELDDARELLVVWDDLDLPLGVVRMRPKGGHGGQNGPRSIIDRIGTQEFPRIRIGIGRPQVQGRPTYEPEVIANYVLSDPPPEEREALDRAVDRAVEVVETAIAEGIEAAMRRAG